MYFRLEAPVAMSVAVPTALPLNFDLGTIKVTLRAPTSEEIGRQGPTVSLLVWAALVERDASPKIREMFDYLARDTLPPDSPLPGQRPSYIDSEGRFTSIPQLKFFPGPFQSFARDVARTLADAVYRVDSVFRWRFRAPGLPRPFFWPLVSWSFDGATWKPMFGPNLFGVDASDVDSPGVTESLRADLERLLQDGVSAPVGQDLYREAWHQRLFNPRSSLVLAVAAVEVGMKECISELVPHTKWLVDNLPSPPVVLMLQDFLPKLPARQKFARGVLAPPEDVLKSLRKGVKVKNTLAHVGLTAAGFKGDLLQELLPAVEDTLWLLDFYKGHSWALDFMRPGTRAALETP